MGVRFFKYESIALYFLKSEVKFIIKVKVRTHEYNFSFNKKLCCSWVYTHTYIVSSILFNFCIQLGIRYSQYIYFQKDRVLQILVRVIQLDNDENNQVQGRQYATDQPNRLTLCLLEINYRRKASIFRPCKCNKLVIYPLVPRQGIHNQKIQQYSLRFFLIVFLGKKFCS